MPKLISVSPSTRKDKKLVAIFEMENGRLKRTHFGQRGASDYTIHKDKERRELYRNRHEKDLDTQDPTRAGYLSWYLLWGDSTSLKKNIQQFKRKFNL